MRLKSIRIRNYKGFRDSELIELGRNWTVVVGRNNAGKSALLEVFSVRTFGDKPHRSISRSSEVPLDPHSQFDLVLEVSGKELERVFLSSGMAQLWVDVPDVATSEDFLRSHFLDGTLELSICWRGDRGWHSKRSPSHGLFAQSGNGLTRLIEPQSDRQRWQVTGAQSRGNDTLPALIGAVLSINTYVFRAERRVNAVSSIQTDLTLQPDASNLAGALHYLFTHNHEQFRRYLGLVREVLPEIEAIIIPPLGNSQVEIRVFNNGYYKERSDLAIPLHECGTGIGQVLAILFVVITAASGRLLVIDEPNSFLHPSASRALMKRLKLFDQHQFIITTHSPEVIGATEPDAIAVVRWENDESRIQVHAGATIASVRSAFDELGVKLSDVYGYDAVVWVEGKTEEKCFPELLKAAGVGLPARVAIVAIVNTGDLDGANAETIWSAYQRLAGQNALTPPAISISLDSETRAASVKHELTIRSDGLIRFLPRRTYENYLLHPAAIASVINAEASDLAISTEQVSEWMDKHCQEAKYFGRAIKSDQNAPGGWRQSIDAPRLLSDLVGELTAHKQDYRGRKVHYGVALTRWLIENDADHLNALIEYVKSLLVGCQTES